MQMKFNSQKVLEFLIETLLTSLDDLRGSKDDFAEGERYAYVECLEIMQTWDEAEKYGLNENIEEKYPLR